jgi:RES domain-containing protein
LLYGSRWTSIGRRGVYLADSMALAILEILVHLGKEELERTEHVGFRIRIPETLVESLPDAALPEGWDADLPGPEVSSRIRAFGDSFLQEGEKPALRVPSAIVPLEGNFLVSLDHPRFARLAVEPLGTVALDRRLKD